MSNLLIILIYSIAAYGLSNMMVFGSGPFRIFEHIRSISNRISEHFGTMFSCMMCFPANVGWVFSLIDWFFLKSIAISPFNVLLAGTGLWWLAAIMDCCFTSGFVWITHQIETFFENLGGGEDNNDEESIEVDG
jgi:hypothetical protein